MKSSWSGDGSLIDYSIVNICEDEWKKLNTQR